jgi:PmbA protein
MATSHSFLPIAKNRLIFEDLVTRTLDYARSLGASDAAAEASEAQGLAVSVRRGKVETVEQTRDRSLDITVFAGQRRGSASTSDFSDTALRQTVEAAWHIARYTAEDPAAGLPDADLLAVGARNTLQLHHPWAVSVAPIAGRGQSMQHDYWSTSDRSAKKLANPAAVGRYAAERALSRLSARRIPTGHFPVLFEAPLALGLLGALTQAVNGGALYRKTSFLLDALGKEIFPSHIEIAEDPHIKGAMGSSPFDEEGVRTQARELVRAGVLQGYFLSSYTARKLGMTTTGNAGGSHNLVMRSTQTRRPDNLDAMLRKMGTGLLVTELIGQGVNYVTGDYSRGAFGYWVQNGKIQHAVEEITIAGNLKEMFAQIVAVGADAITRGSKTTGSILIERMAIAGT